MQLGIAGTTPKADRAKISKHCAKFSAGSVQVGRAYNCLNKTFDPGMSVAYSTAALNPCCFGLQIR